MHGLAPARCVVTQQQHFFKLLPQLPWHLNVHLSESKSSVSLQNLDELFDVPLLLRPKHNDLLVTGYRTQHYCAWVQCVNVVAQNTSTHLRVLEFGRTDSVCPPHAFHKRPGSAPINRAFENFVGVLSLGIQPRGVSASKTDTGTSSPSRVCSCPAPTQNQTR